jgi:hypothetical protein
MIVIRAVVIPFTSRNTPAMMADTVVEDPFATTAKIAAWQIHIPNTVVAPNILRA